jgi:uncharacterized membrane protein YbaN (DUF454 family)
VSKDRARRRAERLTVLEKEKAARARVVARRQQRRALVKKMTPRRGRSGRLHVFTRAEKTGIMVLPLIAAGAVWWLIPDTALRIILIAMIVLVLPVLVVVVLGRR